MSGLRLSVIVPCYNEEGNAASLVHLFGEHVRNKADIELLLVDNGSTDGTAAALSKSIQAEGLSNARVVTVPENKGYGFGILCGLREAKGNILAWTHADLQTDPEDVLKALSRYEAEKEKTPNVFVKGHRKNRRFSEKLFSWGMEVVSSLALGCRVREVNAQPKLFSRDFYALMKDPPHDFSLDLYALYLARKKGYRILSIPVIFKKRLHGEAKGGSGSSVAVRWRLIHRTFAYIFELRKKLKSEE